MTPRELWGTCCPNDPNCEHSFMDGDELALHMDAPVSMDELIKASSLGTAEAESIRAQCPPEVRDEILRRVAGLPDAPGIEAT